VAPPGSIRLRRFLIGRLSCRSPDRHKAPAGDSGDVTSDGAIQGAPWLFSDSQAQNRESLVRLARQLEAEKTTVTAIVPAHSGSVAGLAPIVAFAQAPE